jgi:lipid II:glycine glycyltransferase (peptidoglycan interpeptide bridge formation enzyme)
MKTIFKKELDSREVESIRRFCNSVDYCSMEQFIGWSEILYKSKFCYFYLEDESGIRSYCKIHERFGAALIDFGPVCSEKEMIIKSINEIVNYYKKKGFYYLGIQMYYKTSYDLEYIEYALNKLHNIKYIFNNYNTKSSIEISLEDSLEEIFNRIKKSHKENIKKAIKLGITVEAVKDVLELYSFIDVYSNMCRIRNIDPDGITKDTIKTVYDFLIENKKGEILIVKDGLGKIIGGMILLYQGISVRYYKSCSDPERRDLPILHLAIYSAIKKSKVENFKYFDMWGFDHFADEKNQVFYINQFKKLFGGYFTFFAKKMNINLIPNGYRIHRLVQGIKKNWKKAKNHFKRNN